MIHFPVAAASVDHPRLVQGGMPAVPVITAVQSEGKQVTLQWDGYSGPYQLLFKTNVGAPQWQCLGSATSARKMTVPAAGPAVFYQVAAPPPHFGSAQACASCHLQTHSEWKMTGHAKAWESLRQLGFQTNSTCLPCHSVGFGFSTGFINKAQTPLLAGVQCENCHGPAASHSIYFDDPQLRPRVTISAEVCGGCHNAFHYPTYDEWAGSGHGRVVGDVVRSFMSTNSASQLNACGPCHSGAVRLALLKGDALPSRQTAALQAVTCAVCHDPHRSTQNDANLRNPVASTNFFSYEISAAFALQYNPKVGLCAQCHNARGAAWSDTEQAPHPSTQYNIFLGNIGVWAGAPEQSAHQQIQNQCVQCHTHVYPSIDPAEPVADIGPADHSFKPRPENCSPCHSADSAAARISVTQAELKQLVAFVKAQLDAWALEKAPQPLRDRYGTLAWEYHIPGALSNPSEDPALRGPTFVEQGEVPAAIKQARFNLYLVVQDRSLGVHNGKFARYLLQVATDKVNGQRASP